MYVCRYVCVCTCICVCLHVWVRACGRAGVNTYKHAQVIEECEVMLV